MPVIQEQKFKQKDLEKAQSVISLKLSKADIPLLLECQYRLQQSKSGTTIKQLMRIGAKVVLSSETGEVIQTLLDNMRKNERLGIVDIKEEIDAKVRLKSA